MDEQVISLKHKLRPNLFCVKTVFDKFIRPLVQVRNNRVFR
jgi:hypothetical protein